MPAAKKTPSKPKVTKTGATFTKDWLSGKGLPLKKGDRVKRADGLIGIVIGRWTKPGDERIPFVSIEVVEHGLAAVGNAAVGKGRVTKTVGIAAADLVHAPTTKPRKRTSTKDKPKASTELLPLAA